MKALAALSAVLLLAGCTSKTEFGDCIGAFDDGDPALKYKLSVKNTVLSVIFVETVFVPVIVVANQARCPVGPAEKPKQAPRQTAQEAGQLAGPVDHISSGPLGEEWQHGLT